MNNYDIDHLKKLLSEDKIENVLDILLENKIDDDDSILISGWLNQINKWKITGQVSHQEILLQRNQIRNSVIDLVNNYQQENEEGVENISYYNNGCSILFGIISSTYKINGVKLSG